MVLSGLSLWAGFAIYGFPQQILKAKGLDSLPNALGKPGRPAGPRAALFSFWQDEW
jgi:hypothetical protein